ncbi:MAG TPA: nuclear transport factor 2 family protein [Acidimicrobiales bacterium]|nr:nuclear transport factor 2 family protein [Acidimicrobiales bacterium]
MDPAPTGPDHDEIAAMVDHAAIDRLQRRYADVVNRRVWEDLDAVFAPSVQITLELVNRPTVELSGREEFVAFIDPAMARFGFFQFVILNSHIELWPGADRDAATARIFMCELRTGPTGGQRSEAFGLYRDRYVREPQGWRITRRHYRSLAHFPAGDWLGLPDDLLAE